MRHYCIKNIYALWKWERDREKNRNSFGGNSFFFLCRIFCILIKIMLRYDSRPTQIKNVLVSSIFFCSFFTSSCAYVCDIAEILYVHIIIASLNKFNRSENVWGKKPAGDDRKMLILKGVDFFSYSFSDIFGTKQNLM